MLRLLLRLVLGIVVLLVVVVGVALYLLRDPNQFKPELERQIAAQTGVPVKIAGDLGWQLFPPLALSAADVSADHEGAKYALGRLGLKVNLMSVITTQDINQWEIEALEIDELTMDQGSDHTRIERARLRDFKPDTPSPFEATLTYQSAEDEPIPLDVEGLVAYSMDASRLTLTDTRFETTEASGLCNLEATMKGTVSAPDPSDAVIPVSVWRGYDWSGTCTLDRLTMLEEDFRNVAVTLRNSSGKSTTAVQMPEFFGGAAAATVDIDASRTPVAWKIVPDLERADSEALMSWLDQRLKWIAPLAYSGEITMTGNTKEELVNSVKGKTTFDGGKGKIDISQLKAPLLNLATLLKEGERIAKWPDLWPYERLLGDWTVNGTHHAIDFALDNLTAKLDGTYDPLSDALDMKARVQFATVPEIAGFDVNPVLMDVPIPVNCKGSLEAPDCSLDTKAAQQIVAQVLVSEKRGEIDRQIDEKVPEEYREAAKGLLDMLGGSRKKEDQPPAPN